ncbi:hypothetical protein AAFF_G00171810 [Aldrovandia affinis]|uniref:Uncharacterized protein n=1 Tax=Aldrovandia affinis TaxID=143900 RepID=A0AAD7SYU7_9TELE|nr:hypothetical protein AAFF_G00171810 [Aldrovandia affinis]
MGRSEDKSRHFQNAFLQPCRQHQALRHRAAVRETYRDLERRTKGDGYSSLPVQCLRSEPSALSHACSHSSLEFTKHRAGDGKWRG